MAGWLIPLGNLMNDLTSVSSEDEGKASLIVQDFRASGGAFSHAQSKMINFTGPVQPNLALGNHSTNSSSSGSSSNIGMENHSGYDSYTEYPDYSQLPAVRAVFLCLFIVECSVGVVGNLLVCLTVYRNKSMHSPVNYYIVNLGICDFLVGAVVLPVKLFELMAAAELNMLNNFGCTAIRYLETIVVFASVFTLVAICFERYNAVVYPVQSRINMTNYRIRRVLTLVWVIPGVAAAPSLYPADSIPHFLYSQFGQFTRVTCSDRFSDEFRFWYFMTLFVLMFLIPLCFIAVTCFAIARVLLQEIPVQPRRDPRALSLEQGRRKVAKMVLVVVLAFLICWSPYFIVTVVTQLQSENFLHKGQFFFTMLLINLLAFTNSCVNPFVYFAMSARFRKGFLCIVRSIRYCSRRNRYSPENSLSSVRQTSHRTVNGLLSLQNQSCRRHGSHLANGSSRTAVIRQSASNAPNSTSSPRFDSSTPITPIKSTGNIKVRPVSKHGRERGLRKSRTILLQINHCRNPSCCNHLIPLIESSPRSGEIVIDDHLFPWEESCDL